MEDPDCYNRRSESKKQKYGTKFASEARFPGTYDEAYVLIHRACNLCVLITVLHECSARSNLQSQYCVNTILVRTSGLAKVTRKAGDSSKHL